MSFQSGRYRTAWHALQMPSCSRWLTTNLASIISSLMNRIGTRPVSQMGSSHTNSGNVHSDLPGKICNMQTPWQKPNKLIYDYSSYPCSAPASFSRLVRLMLKNIPSKICIPFLDDILINSATFEDHVKDVDDVLAAHKTANIKLHPEKCQFFRSQVQYLGHEISSEGAKPMSEYVNVVKEWPLPTTRTAVRAYLGKLGYYRRFIKSYAKLTGPLQERLKENGDADNVHFTPSDEFKKSFQVSKDALTSAPILGHPDFSSKHPFVLDTDWSQNNQAAGAVLSQFQK